MSSGKASWFRGSLAGRAEADVRRGETIAPVGDVFEIPLEDIVADPNQPRKECSRAEVLELAASLERHGLLHPIVVRRVEDHWMVTAGHRRIAAAREIGWVTIRATIDRAQRDELAILELQLAENIQRQDISPLETARTYRHMMATWNVTAKDLSAMIGVSPSKISRLLRLLELPSEQQTAVVAGEVSATAAVEAAPRKRPRKVAKQRKPKTWTYRPSRGVIVTVTSQQEIRADQLVAALHAAATAAEQSRGKKAVA